MSTPQRAPIFTATWDFSVWLVKKARAAPNDPLARSLADRALRLLDAITLALKDIDREEALQSADLLLIQLRLRLRLAMETELLDAQQAHYALRQTDAIGRQRVRMKVLDEALCVAWRLPGDGSVSRR